MKIMKVLLACEESQEVCKAFRAKGHQAYSCDIFPCSGGHPEWHIQDDVLLVLDCIKFYTQDLQAHYINKWDLIIAFDPCTYQTNSGVRWLVKNGQIDPERYKKLEESAILTRLILNANCDKIARENPIPHKYALKLIGKKYDQIIQPWQFGHGETKATCLWLKGLPPLNPTNIVSGREQRIWKMSPGPERSKERSKTFLGIAKAMAEQWG